MKTSTLLLIAAAVGIYWLYRKKNPTPFQPGKFGVPWPK